MTRKNRLYRGLALILCLCLTVPYLPVPGHAEGCGHVHGEGCYQEVTQCVHTHGEDCWSGPEAKDAGEEPDACAHVCNEDTGCVTKELNCPHVHDDTCGEQLQEEPEPEPEKPEEPEEPEEPQEPKDEEPKQEEENHPLVISRWEWVDEEEILDPETGVLCLSAEEPILFEQIAELLPKAILATVGEGSQTVPLDHWDPKDYPQETGANSGSYRIDATLPEGYTLAEDAAPLTLHLEFAQAQALAECGHENVNMDTGMCKDCTAQVYVAKIGDKGYITLDDALDAAQTNADSQTECVVTLLARAELKKTHIFTKGRVVLNFGDYGIEVNNYTGFDVQGAALNIQGGYLYSFILDDGECLIRLESGELNLDTDACIHVNGSNLIYASGGTLKITGGRLQARSASYVLKAERNVNVSISELEYFNGTIWAGGRSLTEILEPGSAFFDSRSRLLDASVDSLTLGKVGDGHKDKFNITDGKCACGRVCDHTKANMETGKCLCGQKQLYVAKIGDAGYAMLEAALEDAQKEENKGCTVTVLCDVDASETGYTVSGGAFTLDLNGKKLVGMPITLRQGELTVRNGSISAVNPLTVKNGLLKIESGYYEGSAAALNIQGGTVVLSGGKFRCSDDVFFIKQDEPVMSLLADGKAFYKEVEDGEDVLVDASGRYLDAGTYYVGDHPHTYNATTGKCPCGRTIPQATLTTAPAAAKLTYNGSDQNLVQPGVTAGGKLMYSLAENGTYTETVPTGKKADTYTVWYYVLGTPGKYYNTEKQSLTVTVGKKDLTPVVTIQDQDFDGTKEVKHFTVALEGKEDGDDLTYTLGALEFDAAIPGTRPARLTGTPELKGKDIGNYNLKAPTGLTGKINATSRYLEVPDSLPNADTVTVDGEEYPVKAEGGKRYVMLPDTGSLLTVYSFKTGSDAHTSYPEGMQVYTINRDNGGSTLTEIPEFKDLLTYEGCSIRLNGTKGIRMITSIDQAKKKALVNSDLAGYTLVEYGTVITRESTLGGKTLNLQNVQSYNYNYAYSKANKKDPVFKTENGRIQYTNVLVNFQPADYQTELVLRPYIKLRDASGNEVVLYGGTVTRSIYYIAQQNLGDYEKGSAGYKYLQEILGQK